MSVEVVTKAQLEGLFGQGKDVVVDFYADWCRPCHALAPEISSLASAFDGEVVFVKLDVDAESDYAAELGILGIPTVIHFSADGDEVARTTGVAPASELARRLDLGALTN